MYILIGLIDRIIC
uniref:Uncharacterized protein n=1 Tax=Arundo donax TaxID=35708 RepID=A0A0A8ZPY6_ARUDO